MQKRMINLANTEGNCLLIALRCFDKPDKTFLKEHRVTHLSTVSALQCRHRTHVYCREKQNLLEMSILQPYHSAGRASREL